ncbi:MAG: HAD-IA family hydrolase [Acidobacteria bacterium]|nr:HAD-IA family hydrolase [Acidobacteriota bacterium]
MAASALLFDLDGTVWDSYPCYAAALHSRLGITRDVAVARLRAGENAVRLARGCGLTDTSFSRLCRDSLGELQFYPDVLKTLDNLRQRGAQIGVVTSLPKWLAGSLLVELRVMPYLSTAVYAARKPSPTGIINAVSELRLEPGEVVYYVGDMPSDAQAARRADVSFAWASYGYCDGRPVDADAVLDRFSDVLDL